MAGAKSDDITKLDKLASNSSLLSRVDEQIIKGDEARNNSNYVEAIIAYSFAKAVLCDKIQENNIEPSSIPSNKIIYTKLSKLDSDINNARFAISDTSNGDDEEAMKCTIKNIAFTKGSESCQNWFDTVIGMQREKREIENSFINPLLYPRLYGKISKGILLYGPPGVGKTLIVKAAVNELSYRDNEVNILFFAPTGADMKGKYFGESEKMIKNLFSCASKKACECAKSYADQTGKVQKTISIIFMDEVESVARDRSSDDSGLAATTVNALLQAIDGIDSYENVSVIAATNYPWQLDGAFLRRFDNRILVDLPTASNIEQLINLEFTRYIKKITTSISNGSSEYCNKLLGGSTASKSASSSCKNECVDQRKLDIESGKSVDTDVYGWRISALKNFVNSLTDAQIKAVAAIMFEQKYSNSDISKVFRRATQIAADKAIKENIFVRNDVNGTELYVSSLAYEPTDFIRTCKEERTNCRFIIPPIYDGITLEDMGETKKQFIIKELKPSVLISDQSINNVYTWSAKDDIKNFDILLEFNLNFVQEAPESEEQNHRVQALESYLKSVKVTLTDFSKLTSNGMIKVLGDWEYTSIKGTKESSLVFLKNLRRNQMTRQVKLFTLSQIERSKTMYNALKNAAYDYTVGWFTKSNEPASKDKTAQFVTDLDILMGALKNMFIPSTEDTPTSKGTLENYEYTGDEVVALTELTTAPSIRSLTDYLSQQRILISDRSIFDPDFDFLTDDIKALFVKGNAASKMYYKYIENKILAANIMISVNKILEKEGKGKIDYKVNEEKLNEYVKNFIEYEKSPGKRDEPSVQDIAGVFRNNAELIKLFRDTIKKAATTPIDKLIINPNITFEILKQAVNDIPSSVDEYMLAEMRRYAKDPSKFTFKPKK